MSRFTVQSFAPSLIIILLTFPVGEIWLTRMINGTDGTQDMDNRMAYKGTV
jgi:hypothetical protein